MASEMDEKRSLTVAVSNPPEHKDLCYNPFVKGDSYGTQNVKVEGAGTREKSWSVI
jgi:hypothetical protein